MSDDGPRTEILSAPPGAAEAPATLPDGLARVHEALETALEEARQAKLLVEEMNLTLERKVRQRTEELTALYELSRRLSCVVDDRELFELVFETLGPRARGAVAAWRDADGRVQTARRVLPGEAAEPAARLADALSACLADGRDRPPAAPPGTAVFPLVLEGRVRGYLGLVLPSGGDASVELRWLVETTATQAAMTLERLCSLARAERSLVETTVASMRDGVLVVDRDGRIKVANPAARDALRRLGTDGDRIDLNGRSAAELVDAVLADPSRAVRFEATSADGRTYAVVATVLRGLTGDAAVLTLRDVTGERELREQMLQTEKLSSLGELISGVAHELNNPLTAVLGYSELLLQAPADSAETLRQDVRNIRDAAERARRIVQNLLTFARKSRPEKSLISVNEVLAKTLELREYDMRVNNIELVTRLDPALPPTFADGPQLQQVFLNIVNNAHQAMIEAHGRGRLEVATDLVVREVDAVWVRPIELIRVRFTDDGPGIPPERLRRIFDPFYTTKEPGKGTGLGLSVSYGIVQEHGGRLYAESTPGKGATFVVELPVVEADAGSDVAEATEEPVAPKLGVEARRVLVVDDEEAITDLLTELLSQNGTVVDRAANGREAIERLEDGEYDLVLVDMKMPSMNGRELYRTLETRWPHLLDRLVVVTGDLMSAETEAFLRETGVAHVGKPFSVDELLRRLEGIVGGRRAS